MDLKIPTHKDIMLACSAISFATILYVLVDLNLSHAVNAIILLSLILIFYLTYKFGVKNN